MIDSLTCGKTCHNLVNIRYISRVTIIIVGFVYYMVVACRKKTTVDFQWYRTQWIDPQTAILRSRRGGCYDLSSLADDKVTQRHRSRDRVTTIKRDLTGVCVRGLIKNEQILDVNKGQSNKRGGEPNFIDLNAIGFLQVTPSYGWRWQVRQLRPHRMATPRVWRNPSITFRSIDTKIS